jgi:pimeloyl-ACP methyl ester carboxylesterase
MTQNKKENADASVQFILLRGLARESRHWGKLPTDLQSQLLAKGIKARVDCLDLPGCGRYSEMTVPLSITDMMEFCREKYLELRHRIRDSGEVPPVQTHLIAVSLGGMIAVEWLKTRPSDFKSAVLVNMSMRGFSPFYRRLSPTSYLHMLNIVRVKDPYERERHVLKMISNRPEIYEETAAAWTQIMLDRPVSPENFTRQIIAAARYEAPEDPPPVPLLLLNSKHDRMVHPSCSEEIALRWHAEIRKHATAGHDLPLDDPQWVIEQIVQWQDRLNQKDRLNHQARPLNI